jgi:hypothetical protein
MLIDPTELAFDYVYNDLVEREIASILSKLSGLPVSGFGEHCPRPEYDFFLGQLPVELKITNGVYLPVEVAKDEACTIPSGVAVSIAPYILYISHGHGSKADGSKPVAKVRMLPRKKLLSDARRTPASFYTKGGPTQHALVHYLKGPFFTGDIWLGDMEFKQDEKGERWLYDTSTFTPSRKAAGMLQWLNKGYIDGDLE